ncbi:MAG: hypothetical protein ABTQ32_12795 [Myxococcaceae bacterium]
MIRRVLPLLVMAGCAAQPMKGETILELRASPGSDVDTVKGLLTLTAVATTDTGAVGSGTVRFVTDVGNLTVAEATLDEFGKAETVFSCIEGMHPFCDTASGADVTAQWDSPSKRTVTSRRIAFRRPQLVEVGYSGDGGSGTECTSQRDCQLGLACFDGTCVGNGQLRFSLSWTVASDFDLHVTTPNNKHLFYGNRRDDGGELDVDACVGSSTCRPTNVENIFWRGTPPTGTYKFHVRNFNGRAAGSFRIQVTGTGTPQEFTGMLPASSTDSMLFTVTR